MLLKLRPGLNLKLEEVIINTNHAHDVMKFDTKYDINLTNLWRNLYVNKVSKNVSEW